MRKETRKETYVKRNTEISVLSYSKNIFFLFIGGESPFELRASNPFPKGEKIPDGTDTSVLWRRADAVASAFLSEFAKRGCAEIHVSGNIGFETFFPSSGKLPAAETFSIFVLTSFVFKCAPLKIRTFLQSPEWFSAWEKERKRTDKQVKPVREKLSKPEGWDNMSFFYDKEKGVRSKKNIGQKSANGKNEKSEKQKGGNGTIDRSVGKKRSSAVSLLKETLVELFS